MKIIWLGHSGFRIEIAGQVLLIDPWLTGNPMFPADKRAEALAGATHILISHGHGDHAGNAVEIAKELNLPILAVFELAEMLSEATGIDGIAIGRGGTAHLGDVAVTLVAASHSSSFPDSGTRGVAGSECGFMIAGEGRKIYFSGDTDIMADMDWFGDYHRPDIGIMSAGGVYTMDMAAVAYAAKRYFNFKTLIPCHYRTFGALEQSADALKAALPNVEVVEPQVMQAITL
jgi:L-ascorbate metabolism protein UlaG (beta-lactamase superfamily)